MSIDSISFVLPRLFQTLWFRGRIRDQQLKGTSSSVAFILLTIGRSEVCLYFKDHLPLASRLKFITLDECLVCEIQNGFKRFFITVLYRSPSRASSNFLYSNKGWRKQSLILMIAVLLLQCMLDILMPEIQSDEMVILRI